MKRVCRLIFGVSAGLSALLCAASLLPNLFPGDIAMMSILTPGSNVWRVMIRNPVMSFAWMRPWLNAPHPALGIRIHEFSPAFVAMPPSAVWVNSFTSSTRAGVELLSGAVSLAPFGSNSGKSPQTWDMPIHIASGFPPWPGSPLSISIVYIPLSTASPILALLPAVWIVLALRRRLSKKPKEGHCPVCGYDLRATPEKCPECGTIQQASTQSTR